MKEALSRTISSLGFKWVNTLWGPEARWLQDPDEGKILLVAQTALKLDPADPCSIAFLAQGAFNKLYVVTSAGQDYVVRLTLPIFPAWKTESEVATMEWVRRTTTMPVPHVHAHMPDRSNDMASEWIIMEKARGKTLADMWRELDFSAKEVIVRRMATFASATFKHQTHGIGSLFYSKSRILKETLNSASPFYVALAGDSNLDSIVVGPSISSAFISPCSPPIPHGPFVSTREWIYARIDFALADCRHRLQAAQQSGESENKSSDAQTSDGNEGSDDGGEDSEDLENAIGILERLKPLVNSFFPADTCLEPEPSMLFHDDLNKQNILVDETEAGTITAVLDWESISTVPLFVGCQYPPFLQGRPSDERPVKTKYKEENGDTPELYCVHLDMYELTQLRKLFLAEMRRMQPGWAEIFDASQRQRDFDLAINCADDLFMGRRLQNWLTELESDATDAMGLEERIDRDMVA